MKTVLWLVLGSLLIGVMGLTSCAVKAPEAPPAAKTETTQIAPPPPPKPEPKPASFSVSGLTITPAEVNSGSSVTIKVTVTNIGEMSGTYDVNLRIDDTVEATEKVTLDGGASQNVTFTKSRTTARTYAIAIGELTGTFVVKALPPPPAPTPSPPPAPAQTWTEYVNPVYGWSISYPSRWTNNSRTYVVTVNGTDPARVQIALTGAVGGADTVTISSSLGDFTRLSRDDLVNHWLLEREAFLKKQDIAMTVTLRGLLSLPNDITADDLVEEDQPGGKARMIFVPTDKQGIVISAGTSKAAWNLLSPIFDRMVKSFTMKKQI